MVITSKNSGIQSREQIEDPQNRKRNSEKTNGKDFIQ